jgi:hypothetical protein
VQLDSVGSCVATTPCVVALVFLRFVSAGFYDEADHAFQVVTSKAFPSFNGNDRMSVPLGRHAPTLRSLLQNVSALHLCISTKKDRAAHIFQCSCTEPLTAGSAPARGSLLQHGGAIPTPHPWLLHGWWHHPASLPRPSRPARKGRHALRLHQPRSSIRWGGLHLSVR